MLKCHIHLLIYKRSNGQWLGNGQMMHNGSGTMKLLIMATPGVTSPDIIIMEEESGFSLGISGCLNVFCQYHMSCVLFLSSCFVQALIHLGKFSAQTHVLADYRTNLVQFYPEHMYTKERFLFFARAKPHTRDCEELFLEAHKRVSFWFCCIQ